MARQLYINIEPDHHLVSDFIEIAFPGKSAQSVPRTRSMKVAQCYFNVVDHVNEFGGTPVYGWLLAHWPGRFVEAVHHAVVQNTDGELEDVTAPAFPLMRGSSITFIEDNDVKLEAGQQQPFVPSQFLAIDRSQDAQAFMHATVQFVMAMEAHAAILSAEGITVASEDQPIDTDNLSRDVLNRLYKTQAQLNQVRESYDKACVALVAEDMKNPPGRNDPCWCGSGKKFKHCHR